MKIEFTSHVAEVKAEFEEACLRALERCGMQAESYAKDLAPVNKDGYGGTLRNSITHKVAPTESAVYVGTNLEYAPYVELGTGSHAKGGGGRQGWWVYVKDSDGSTGKRPGKIYTFEEARKVMAILRSKGLDAHMTNGQDPQPFLKPAVADHARTYRNIIEDELKNG